VRLVLTPMAQADFVDIAKYVAEATASGQRGLAFAAKLRAQCEKLAELPGSIGRPRPELGTGLRSLPFGDWLIVFRYGDEVVEIARVLGGRRDVTALFADHPND